MEGAGVMSPYLPDERGFWRCPVHVLMALFWVIVGVVIGAILF